MFKRILLLVCLLVALSGVAQAEIVSEVDTFDQTKYVYSYFKNPEFEKSKELKIKNLVFRKIITTDRTEYILTMDNSGKSKSSVYNNFLVKFDDSDSEIYKLTRRGNDIFGGYEEIVLIVPENVVAKILTSDKITLKVPLNPKGKNNYEISRNITVNINLEIINEWRQVIKSQ